MIRKWRDMRTRFGHTKLSEIVDFGGEIIKSGVVIL